MVRAAFIGDSGRVSSHARSVHGSDDRAAASHVRGSGRHRARRGAVGDESGPAVRAPRQQSPFGEIAGWHVAADPFRKVLRAGVDSAGGCRHHRAGRARHHEPRGRALRQQPGVQAESRRRAERPSSRRVVRQRHAAAQWLGVRTGLSRGGRGGPGGVGRGGKAVPVRARNHLPRPAARHVQVPVQRDLSRGEERAGGCLDEHGSVKGQGTRTRDKGQGTRNRD